jgi:hypothetical protein
MLLWKQICVAIGLDLAAATMFYPALHLKGFARTIALLLLGILSAASTFAIAPAHRVARFAAVLVTSGVAIKFYDLAREASAGRVPPLRTYVRFMANSFWHVLRRRPPDSRSRQDEFRAMLIRFPQAAAALGAAYLVFRVHWTRFPFVLEHGAKVLAVYAVLAPLLNGFAAEWRFLGQPALDTMRHPLLAVTPADFWRRWNRPTQLFFHEHVFGPAGGWRAPIRATLITFAVSGLLHECVFGVAAGRVQYVQFCFFMLQGIAVSATLSLRPCRGAAVADWVLTLLFNLFSSILFFASVQAILPFYVSRQ